MTRKTTPEKQPATKAPDRGEAYAGVTDTLTMGGVAYHLTFNNMTFVHIENIYRERYKRTVGLPQVFAELIRRGWSDANLAKLAGGNVLSALRGAERVAAEMKDVSPAMDKLP